MAGKVTSSSVAPATVTTPPTTVMPTTTSTTPATAVDLSGLGVVSTIPGPLAPQGEVALTFDDGPSAFTAQVLAVLAARGAVATFFMVGRAAERNPDLVRAIAAAGDAVGGHTWDHVRLPSLTQEEFAAQVDRTDDLLASLTGRAVRCLRPPYGRYDSVVLARLRSRGLAPVMWDVDPRDWTAPGIDAIVARVAAGLHPGAVIELHDGGGDRSQTVAALPVILDLIAARGYRAVQFCL